MFIRSFSLFILALPKTNQKASASFAADLTLALPAKPKKLAFGSDSIWFHAVFSRQVPGLQTYAREAGALVASPGGISP